MASVFWEWSEAGVGRGGRWFVTECGLLLRVSGRGAILFFAYLKVGFSSACGFARAPPPVLGDSAALLRDCSTFFYLIVDTTTISTTTKLTVFGLLRKTTTGTTQATIVVVGVTLFALPASDYNYQERYCASLQNACVINSA